MIDGDHALLVETAMPVCAEYGLGLAGGYAVKAHGLVDRPSDDVDFATAAFAPMPEIAEALREAYRQAGFGVEPLAVDERKGHMLVTLPSGATYRVDIMKEPLNHPLTMMRFGLVVAVEDTVAMKMSALYDRCLPRDVMDIRGAAARFSHAELIAFGRGIIEDFRLENLRDQLDFAAMYPDEAFTRYGLDPARCAEIRTWAQQWSTDLAMEIAENEPITDD
jgi:hypothetical protein